MSMPGRIVGLDLARSLAITLVVLAHYFGPLHALGAYGVELFFALSGFLIGGILLRLLEREQGWDWGCVWNFWQRRWWRTLPNYFLFLGVMLVFHWLTGGLPGWLGFLPYLVFCQNMAQGELGFFGVSWSLCIEEWFYLVFPLLIWLLSRAMKLSWAFSGALVLLLVGATFGRWWLASRGVDDYSLRMMTLVRLDAIGYGVVAVAMARRRLLSGRDRGWCACLGLVVLTTGVALGMSSGLGPWALSIRGMLPVLGFALVLPWLEAWSMVSYDSTLGPGVVRVSVLSYSIYLCHMPVQRLVYWMFGELREVAVMNVVSKLLGVLGTWLISELCYRFYEYKMTQRRPAEL